MIATVEMRTVPLPYVYDDGGRTEAGFKGEAGDCVTRALAIANGALHALEDAGFTILPPA